MKTGTLIFFCGKMGAGKSTRAQAVLDEINSSGGQAVLLSEDDWLTALYPNEINSIQDYAAKSALLRPQIKQLAISLLATGVDVVMDFPANMPRQRAWFKDIVTQAGADHRLIYIEASDETCLNQIEKRRREQPERAATDTPEMFHAVSHYFSPPSPNEGFHII